MTFKIIKYIYIVIISFLYIYVFILNLLLLLSITQKELRIFLEIIQVNSTMFYDLFLLY